MRIIMGLASFMAEFQVPWGVDALRRSFTAGLEKATRAIGQDSRFAGDFSRCPEEILRGMLLEKSVLSFA